MGSQLEIPINLRRISLWYEFGQHSSGEGEGECLPKTGKLKDSVKSCEVCYKWYALLPLKGMWHPTHN